MTYFLNDKVSKRLTTIAEPIVSVDRKDRKVKTIDLKPVEYVAGEWQKNLNVSFDENIANISIYNLLGQEVIYKTINANQGSVDVSNLAAGTYLIRVTSHNEEVKTLKIIKE